MSKVKLFVRDGYGVTLKNLDDLPSTELDRLTSNTRSAVENLSYEFQIEQEVKELGDKLGVELVTELPSHENGIILNLKSNHLTAAQESELVYDLKLPFPKSIKLSDYKGDPAFPFILKNPEGRKGREVYYITDSDALEKVYTFCNSSHAKLSNGVVYSYNPYPESELFLCQQFIRGISSRYTTYRVTVGANGKVYSTVLTYSGNDTNASLKQVKVGNTLQFKRDLFTIPDSPFYLNSNKVVSNKSSGGGWIVLNPTGNSKPSNEEEKLILKQHGLNGNNPQPPTYIIDESIRIATYLKERRLGILAGIDWIQSEDKNFYYLETNLSPAGGPFNYSQSNGIGTHEAAITRMLTDVIVDFNMI